MGLFFRDISHNFSYVKWYQKWQEIMKRYKNTYKYIIFPLLTIIF